MNVLRLFLEICLLRGKPQDLPTSVPLLVLTVAANVVIEYLSLGGKAFSSGELLFVLFQVMLLGGGLWLILRQRRFANRWIQTATALFAANVFFSLLMLPLLPTLHEMAKVGPAMVINWQLLVAFALSVWSLMVMAHVMREALEISRIASFVVSLALMISIFMLSSFLAAVLGLYQEQ